MDPIDDTTPQSDHPADDPTDAPPESQLEKAPEEIKQDDPWYKDTKIWINLVGYIAVTTVLVIVKVWPEIIPMSDRDFPCNDRDLKYPSRINSVKQKTLIISTVSILLMSVFISEGVYSISPEYQSQRSLEALNEVPLKEKVLLFINLVTSKLLYSYLGLILTMNFTYITQHLVGGLRPDFLVTCDLRKTICTQDSMIAKLDHCNNKDVEMMADARLSFPCEYASISFYMTVFSSMIIERAISNDYFALKIAVQGSYIMWAIYVSASRIKDHKNHPIDAFAGALLGTIIAFLTDYLSSYQEYQDLMGYDPSNITLNIHDWEDGEQPLDEHGEMPSQQEYPYP